MKIHTYKISDNCVITFKIYEGDSDDELDINIDTLSYIIIDCDNVQSKISLEWKEEYDKKLDDFINKNSKNFNIHINNGGPVLLIKDSTLEVSYQFCENQLTTRYFLVNQY